MDYAQKSDQILYEDWLKLTISARQDLLREIGTVLGPTHDLYDEVYVQGCSRIILYDDLPSVARGCLLVAHSPGGFSADVFRKSYREMRLLYYRAQQEQTPPSTD